MKTQGDFQGWANRSIIGIVRMLEEKGNQYTGLEQSAFENFEKAAEQWGSTVPYEILQFAQKHWSFLVKYAQASMFARKDHGVINMERDKIQESAQDIVIYMLLLIFYLEEEPK